MGYNDTKEWLDDQHDTISALVELANTQGVTDMEFTDTREARNYQFYIRNVLFGLAIHHPHYRDVCEAIRTWRTNDYEGGKFIVHIGIPNTQNYHYQRRGKTHLHRRLPPPTVPGRRPAPPVYGTSIIPPTTELEKLVNTKPDIFEVEDEVNATNYAELLPTILEVAKLRNSQLIDLKHVNMTRQLVQSILESIPEWAHDSSQMSDDGQETVTALILRRRSSPLAD